MAKTPEAKPRSATPFNEKNGDCRSWLGNPRWNRIPFFPVRERVQQVVDDVQRAKAKRIADEFCAARSAAEANDIAGTTARIAECERSGISQQAVEAQALRQKLETMKHDVFVSAQAKELTLIDEAAEVVKKILDAAIVSYDEELNAVALEFEATMTRLGIPLFVESVNGVNLTINGKATRPTRVWRLWDRDECTLLHSCREVVRNCRQKFDHDRHLTLDEIKRERAIPTLLYLCSSSEEVNNFSWT
jgi:hypothetical protein